MRCRLPRGDRKPYKRALLQRPQASGADPPSSPKVMSQTIELTKALIARRSVTPADEGCQQLLIERLAATGFRVEHLGFGSVENFWARRGGAGPVFCFAGDRKS